MKNIDFLENDKKIINFLNDFRQICDDIKNDNYFEKYPERISTSEYGSHYDEIDNTYFVSSQLLDKMKIDYRNKNMLSTEKTFFSGTGTSHDSLTHFDQWPSHLKNAYMNNIKDGFSWSINCNFLSIYEHLDRQKSHQKNPYSKHNIVLDPTSSRTSLYIEMETLQNLIAEHFPDRNIKRSGGFWYRPDDYMGWHNNHNRRGSRIYVTYADENGKSFFRYYDNEEHKVITTYDKKGWTIRMFDIPNNPDEYYWHCVYSRCNRFSFGFNVEPKDDK